MYTDIHISGNKNCSHTYELHVKEEKDNEKKPKIKLLEEQVQEAYMDTSYTGCGFTVSAHSFHPACDNLNVSFAPS